MLVIGVGGVGGVLGARLALSGADVSFVARGEHGRVLATRGLYVELKGEKLRTPPLRVASLEACQGPFDVVLVCVKHAGLDAVGEELPRLLAPSGVVLPMLNGLESEEVCASYVGAQRVVASVAYMSSGLLGPGDVYLHGTARVGLAPFRHGQEAIIEHLTAVFSKAGLTVRRADDAATMLWEKMVWNAPFNGICALSRQTAGYVANQLEPLVREAMAEVVAVARAEGVMLPAPIGDMMLLVTRSDFPDTEPSMLQDVRAGRSTEVDILQGAVVARGARHGVETKVMSTLASLLRGLAH